MRPIAMLPNILTTSNIVCGVWAMTLCFQGTPKDLEQACWLIILAAVFDGLDGRVARWAKVSSKFGVELDSLADMVSFGVAPALLLWSYSLHNLGILGRVATIAVPVCGALRLARFNVGTGEGQSPYYFQGSPIPAAAALLVSLVLFDLASPIHFSGPTIASAALFAALMMVSSFPYPAAKKTPATRTGRMLQALFPAGVLLGIVVYRQNFMFALGLAYMASGPLWSLSRVLGHWFRRAGSVPPPPEEKAPSGSP
jgi:CDP-diacylglycerol--serine O-phosphatidyltransferase